MSILNFVTQDELDDLDEDDRQAFMQLVNLAQRSLSEQLKRFDQRQEDEWREAEEVRHSFMNVVIAASKKYNIEPFCFMEVPRINDQLNFQQFRSDLDHYVTQLILDNSEQTRRHSVLILPNGKERIRSYVHALRDCIEKASMDDKKRGKLLDRLDELEKELEKRRTSYLAVAKLAYDILAIPGTMWASYDITTKLVSNVSQVVEESREAEQANKPLAIAKPMPALSAPRKPATPARGFGGGYSDDLDDDVPF